MHSRVNRSLIACLLACAAMLAAGCSSEAKYRVNRVELRVQARTFQLDEQTRTEAERQQAEENGEEIELEAFEFSEEQLRNLSDILTGLFGTPDEPQFPAVKDDAGAEIRIVDSERLKMAAGPFGNDDDGNPRGLYRQHCAHCHGVTGDGFGPTATFLNPYPRDYRHGKFKFKSTKLGVKPTQADLQKIIGDGIPGTAMPAFNVLLSKPEMAAIIDYVKYLSVRGEVERELVALLATRQSESEAPDDESLPPKVKLLDFAEEGEEFETVAAEIEEIVNRVAGSWSLAQSAPAFDRPANWYEASGQLNKKILTEKIALGRELFYTKEFNCFSCHGETALGDGGQRFYDDWTKEVFTAPPASPKEEEEFQALVEEFTALGALKPRILKPRNLRLGVYRGGHRPIDLFYRITNGIEGTPMPGINTPPKKPGETDEEYAETMRQHEEKVWAVVEYVRSLPYESISQPGQDHKPLNEKKFR